MLAGQRTERQCSKQECSKLIMAARLGAALWGSLAVAACCAAPGARESARTSRPPAVATVSTPPPQPEAPAGAPAPVRWVLLPKWSHWAPAFQRTTDAGTLYAGPGNERWLLREGEAARGAGPDAVTLAGALPNAAGHSFITPGGDVYEASSALGELSLAVVASKPFVAATAGRDHFLAIDDSGKLHRSGDRGRTWQASAVPSDAGRFTDVLMLENGTGLVLAGQAGKSELLATRGRWRSPDRMLRIRVHHRSRLARRLGTLA